MKTSLMFGAMALGVVALSPGARARNFEFGFYSNTGGSYCDGVKFAADKLGGAGYHIYDRNACPYPKAVLGGFSGPLPALGPGRWYTFPVSLSAGDGLSQAYVLVFYINVQALAWALYYESTDYGLTYQEINSGVLIKGKPYSMTKPGEKRLGSVIAETMAALKK